MMNERRHSLKRLQAFIAASIVTAVLAACMLAVGASAAMNQNVVPVLDVTAAPNAVASTAPTPDQNQIAQLNNLVKQYQDREKQYQTQLNQANTQLQQYQSLLQDLQRRGIIRINSDGTIQLRVQKGD